MFRGLNTKNFYVAKLEQTTTGLSPKVAFVRYAVIDGKAEGRTQKDLNIKARVDTMYDVRFDAIGPNFAVWIGGEKVDEWRDARLGSGGVGFYSESGETGNVQSDVRFFELLPTGR